jgi:shikimate 5-dehydrogenase
MYFIGVTTSQSSINVVFPLWAERLQLGDCELRGLDFALHDQPQRYRAAVEFIKRDPLSLGALVTTHKIDLYTACADQFDVMDPLTRSLGEISSIFKRDGLLHGRTVDPLTSGLALNAFLPPHHWRDGAAALILGAGGAGTALTWHLSRGAADTDRPTVIHVTDPLNDRLDKLQCLHAGWPASTRLEVHRVSSQSVVRDVLQRLPRGSVVANATGLGKDSPGSPLPGDAIFPEGGYVWEFNYRGDLVFLQQARAQQTQRNLHIEDGWTYFLHGWTRVIADVFNCEIPTAGPVFDDLGQIAAAVR